MPAIEIGSPTSVLKADATVEFSLTCSLLAFLVALVMQEHDLG